jgi:hypothetical protein
VKDALRTAVGACLIPAMTARLTGVTRVYALHVHPTFLCLVVHKGEELRERPTLQFPPGPGVLAALATSDRRGFADSAQVLKDEGRPFWHAVHDAFGEHMIWVSVEPRLLLPYLFEVTFGAFARQWIGVFV